MLPTITDGLKLTIEITQFYYLAKKEVKNEIFNWLITIFQSYLQDLPEIMKKIYFE